MTVTTTTEHATGTAPDLIQPALAGYAATLPPDDDLARLAEALTAAYAAVEAERERGAALRRRRAAIAAALATATGADRTKRLQELLLVDADAATVPAAIGEATRRYGFCRLAWLARVLALAEAEAAALVRATDGPIAAAGRARVALDVAGGYFGAVQQSPETIAELRAEAARLGAAVAPDVERHGRATAAAALVRGRVAMAFGEGVRGFAGPDRTTVAWETVAERAGSAATERARREAAGSG